MWLCELWPSAVAVCCGCLHGPWTTAGAPLLVVGVNLLLVGVNPLLLVV